VHGLKCVLYYSEAAGKNQCDRIYRFTGGSVQVTVRLLFIYYSGNTKRLQQRLPLLLNFINLKEVKVSLASTPYILFLLSSNLIHKVLKYFFLPFKKKEAVHSHPGGRS